jgi:hypothetical protein
LAFLPAACGGSETVTVTEATTLTETVSETVSETVTVTETVTSVPDLATRRFQLPTGNIGCLLAAGVLRCDILSGLQPEPAEDCDFDWVGVELGRTGAAAPNCGSDTIFAAGMPTLAYGSTWSRGGVTCESAESGLSCTNGDGHGLTLARGSWTAT